MRVSISGDSEAEFLHKRHEILKNLAGDEYDIVEKALKEIEPKEAPVYLAQRQMIEYWNGQYKEMLAALKIDIEKILNEK